ncbi:hypothetical protein CYMTET_31047 [Cymbomonas tetramitiformis]|uniref:Uncharacterized protein n=1 Tax=Cymbomonas tetramitiformis TaxID=36881 RepID=A0AAE0KTA1_9CHLO|nr:hypothetical protein CYMTET_31047 [Cymbomonas tetramitiformis]
MAFHRGTGQTIPLSAHLSHRANTRRAWRGKQDNGTATARTAVRVRRGRLLERTLLRLRTWRAADAFQHAIDGNATDRFDALCYLAGGKPVMLEDLSVRRLLLFSVAEEDSEDDDEGLPPPRQALGCGRPPLGFGYSALTSLAVCMLFIVCAAAVPSAALAFGGVSMGAEAAPPVGGVVDGHHGHPEMLLATTTAFRTSSIDNRGLGSTQNYPTHDLSAAPEHTAPTTRSVVLPPVSAPTLPMPPSPGGGAPPSPAHSELPSPDYTPPASDEEGEGGQSSIDYNSIGTFSFFCSTRDSSGSANTEYASEGSGTNSPGRCDSGTGSPGRCGSG